MNAAANNETNLKWAEAGTVTWRMVYDANSNKIVLRDEVNSLNVFTIEDNSVADIFYINSSGKIGINNTNPFFLAMPSPFAPTASITTSVSSPTLTGGTLIFPRISYSPYLLNLLKIIY